MSSGSSNSSILNMPDYGQGLAEALQAQSDALSGKLTGTPLQEIVERYERPLRMSAAQIDNDVLRQTLLGDRVPITAGQPQPTAPTAPTDPLQPTPQEPAPTTQVDYGGAIEESTGKVITGQTEIDPRWATFRSDIARAGGDVSEISLVLANNKDLLREVDPAKARGYVPNSTGSTSDPDFVFKALATNLALSGSSSGVDSLLNDYGNPEPIYRKNEDGTDFVVPKDASGNFILESEQNNRSRRTGGTQIDYGGAVDESTGKVIVGQGEIPQSIRDLQEIYARDGNNTAKLSSSIKEWAKTADLSDFDTSSIKSTIQSARPGLQGVPGYFDKGAATGLMNSVLAEGILYNTSNTLESFLDNYGKAEPIYKKNPDGTDFVVPKDADGNFILEANDQSEVPDGGTLPTTPTGPTTPAQPVDAENITGYKRAGTGLIDMLGDRRMALDPTTGLSSNRESGFDDQGNFLGLAALAEDIQRGNLSRQREADLADVERLSGRFQDVMADYKPATASGIEDAKSLLEQQFQNLSGMSKATQADVDAGNASEVGEMLQTGGGQGGPISMPNELDPMQYAMSGEAGLGKVVSDRDQGGRRVKYYEDSLRSALLGDAKEALSQGLTDRETRAIQNSARARSGLMGRTFDQSGAIDESKALIQENNNRRMQNRAFAQSALGQEVGIQTGDVSRAMTADQFNVGAKMDAERLDETLRQQGVGNYINAVGNLAQIEDKTTLDPFQAILGRAGGGSLQAGQGVFGQAGYGLQSGPQYMNPEAGLGYISSMAANQANMYAANQSANASRNAGMMGGLGSLGGGIIGGLIGLA
jgi:hypothetical protein